MRRHLTYANVMSTVAVFVVLGGGAYAATSLPAGSVTSKQIKNGSIHGRDIANAAITSRQVKTHSLLAGDFRPGSLPSGPQGPQGPPGASATALWAVVSYDGTVESSSNPSITAAPNGPAVFVDFHTDITHCAIEATQGKVGSPYDGYTVNAAPANPTTSPTQVRVQYNAPANDGTSPIFNVAVFC